MSNDVQKTVKAIGRLTSEFEKEFFCCSGRTSVSVMEIERVATLTTRLSESFCKPLIIEQISQGRHKDACEKIDYAIIDVLVHLDKNKKFIGPALEAGGSLFLTDVWKDMRIVKEFAAHHAPYVALVRNLGSKRHLNTFDEHILGCAEADAHRKKQLSRKPPCDFFLLDDDSF